MDKTVYTDGELAMICNTGDATLDGTFVVIVGNCPIGGTNFYTIEKQNCEMFSTGYRTIRLIESCLTSDFKFDKLARLEKAVVNLVQNVKQRRPHADIIYEWDQDRGSAWFGS